jgi:NitT/TauT family transport system permease protein
MKNNINNFSHGGNREPFWNWKIFAVLSYAAALMVNFLIPPVIQVDELPFRALLAALTAYFGVRHSLSARGIRAEKFARGARFYSAVGILFIIWDVLSSKTGVLPLPFFPGPAQIMEVMFRERRDHAVNCLYSLRLFAAGFAAGSLCGSVSGILIGWSDRWYYWLFPIMKVVGVVPAIALVPLVLIVMPDTFSTAVALVAISAWFPVAFTTARGIRSIDRTYFEAARVLGAGGFYTLREIAIPGAVPSIFTGISTATGIAFSTLVVSEMIGARGGLGYYINLAMGWMNYACVYAAIVIMAILFISVLTAINGVKNRLLVWQRGLVK